MHTRDEATLVDIDRVHLPTLWETVTVDLPAVLRQLGPLLPRSPEGEAT